MPLPTMFRDPTSESGRAVHWFALEAGIELKLELNHLAHPRPAHVTGVFEDQPGSPGAGTQAPRAPSWAADVCSSVTVI